MADDDKIGTVWSDGELDAIVADYFAMLRAELAGEAYIKSHHSAALMQQIGRTHRSVEFKHQNISAVLEELGMPWIQGYKPKRNYQNAIFGAIDRYLSSNGEAVTETVRPSAPAPIEEGLFVEPPALQANSDAPPMLARLVRKFDAVERDHRNRALGKAGEEFVLNLERRLLTQALRADLAKKVRWVAAEDGDGAGYDIHTFDSDGKEKLVEVKTTNGSARTPFFLTRNELEVSKVRSASWRLYRVHLFAQTPRIFTLAPPLEDSVRLRTETWRASWR